MHVSVKHTTFNYNPRERQTFLFKRKSICAKQTKFKLGRQLKEVSRVLHNKILYLHDIRDKKYKSSYSIKICGEKYMSQLLFIKSGCDKKRGHKRGCMQPVLKPQTTTIKIIDIYSFKVVAVKLMEQNN